MKILFSLLLIALSASFSFGQTTYEIKQLGTQYSQEQLTQTFSSADFCGSYFMSKRNTIQLNDGAIVELKSQQEMTASGNSLPSSCVLEDNVTYHQATWSIAPNGLLMKAVETYIAPAEMKLKVIHN